MEEKLSFKLYLPIIFNIIFTIILFSLMFVGKSDFSYLSEFNSYQPNSLQLNIIGTMIIFKIVFLAIILCFSIVELFIYRIFLLKSLNITNLVLITFFFLLEVVHLSLAANKTVTYNNDSNYKIFDGLNYIMVVCSVIYVALSYTLYFRLIKKEINYFEGLLKEYQTPKPNVLSQKFTSKEDLFNHLKKLHEEGKISDIEYKTFLEELVDDEKK